MGLTAKRGTETRSRRRRRQRQQAALLNFFAGLLALGTLVTLLWFGLIYINPWNPFNPFPPPPRSAQAAIQPSPTVQPTEVEAPLAPTLIPPTPTATTTSAPQNTPVPTIPPTIVIIPGQPTPRLSPTPTRAGYVYPYMLQGAPAAIAASLFSPDRGCRWLGIAGQVFDKQNRPATGIRVWLNGTFNNTATSVNTLTGTALRYGQSGYEFTLSDRPISSKGPLYVRLMDQTDVQISERVSIDTYEDCNRNLIVVNFVQVK